MKISLVNPRPEREAWRNAVLKTIAKVRGGYIVDDYLSSGSTFFVSYDEYVEVEPSPDDELAILRKKVYEYEMVIGDLLIYPDLIIQAVVKSSLDIHRPPK